MPPLGPCHPIPFKGGISAPLQAMDANDTPPVGLLTSPRHDMYLTNIFFIFHNYHVVGGMGAEEPVQKCGEFHTLFLKAPLIQRL